ncbi:MAG: hypothetical protein GXP43_01615 [bacterium]|nr:hypothetical protein [bacterium]
MTIKQWLHYFFIAIGVVVALLIVALTVINVKKAQDRQVLASKLECRLNWCRAVIKTSANGYTIQINSPFKASYPVKSFNLDLNTKLNRSMQVKGVLKNKVFYITDTRP